MRRMKALFTAYLDRLPARGFHSSRWDSALWAALFLAVGFGALGGAIVATDKPSEEDEGLLTASEVAMLKLNADFIVLSACNTAAGDKPGAEALSGLARAFFYAGVKSLVVSHWEVDSEATVALMDGLFEALKTNPRLSHAEALRMSMLRMIVNSSKPEWAQPEFWAPFVVVGEPMKLR
jgi:CHAT domain-containing protein